MEKTAVSQRGSGKGKDIQMSESFEPSESRLISKVESRTLPEVPEKSPIYLIRKQKGLNIYEAADRLGISKDKLLRMEKGEKKNTMEHIIWLIELGAYDKSFSESKLVKQMRAWRMRDEINQIASLEEKRVSEIENLVRESNEK